jgi:hypothetical protein
VRADVVLANVDLGDHVTGHPRGQLPGVTSAFPPCYHGDSYATAAAAAAAAALRNRPPTEPESGPQPPRNRSRYWLTFKGSCGHPLPTPRLQLRSLLWNLAKKGVVFSCSAR